MKVICVMVSTADGIIARHSGHNVDWSSPEDKEMFTAVTKRCGVVIEGRSTYEAIGRPLPGRLNIVMTSQPEQYAERQVPGKLEFCKGSPAEILGSLGIRGFKEAALIGGPHLNAAFFKADLVDELLLSVEPRLFGQGLNLSEGEELDIKMELTDHELLNPQTMLLRYKILRK